MSNEKEKLSISPDVLYGQTVSNAQLIMRVEELAKENADLKAEVERLKEERITLVERLKSASSKFPLKSGLTFGEGYGCLANELLELLNLSEDE